MDSLILLTFWTATRTPVEALAGRSGTMGMCGAG